MNRPGRCAFLACLVLVSAAFCGPAWAQDLGTAVKQTYPTNYRMLEDVAESAVSELMIGFQGPPDGVLVLEAEGSHSADWFIENLLLNRLNEAGFSAFLKAVAEEETDGTNGDSLETAPPPEPEPGAEYVFRYRIVEFGMSYPDTYRKSPLGSKQVQRLARCNLQAHLLAGERERVVWGNTSEASRSDVVPSKKLSLLEGDNSPFTAPALDSKGLSGLVEPALVTGIVIGLVYLFYANQN